MSLPKEAIATPDSISEKLTEPLESGNVTPHTKTALVAPLAANDSKGNVDSVLGDAVLRFLRLRKKDDIYRPDPDAVSERAKACTKCELDCDAAKHMGCTRYRRAQKAIHTSSMGKPPRI